MLHYLASWFLCVSVCLSSSTHIHTHSQSNLIFRVFHRDCSQRNALHQHWCLSPQPITCLVIKSWLIYWLTANKSQPVFSDIHTSRAKFTQNNSPERVGERDGGGGGRVIWKNKQGNQHPLAKADILQNVKKGKGKLCNIVKPWVLGAGQP